MIVRLKVTTRECGNEFIEQVVDVIMECNFVVLKGLVCIRFYNYMYILFKFYF
jgi:hypothetical protein